MHGALFYLTEHADETKGNQSYFQIRIPHCLKGKEHLALDIKVRHGHIDNQDPFQEIQPRDEGSGDLPYFEVNDNYIIIYTTSFSQFVCSSCKKKCDSYIMAFPFGSLDQLEDDKQSLVSVMPYLCCSLYDIEDFQSVSQLHKILQDILLVHIING